MSNQLTELEEKVVLAKTFKGELIHFTIKDNETLGYFEGKKLQLPNEMQHCDTLEKIQLYKSYHWFKLSCDCTHLQATLRLLGGMKGNPGPEESRVVGAQSGNRIVNETQAVGAQAAGLQAVGAQAVGAQAVGLEAIGAQAVGAQAVGAQAAGAQAAGLQAVGAQAVAVQAVAGQAVGAQAAIAQAHIAQICGADAQVFGARVVGICGLQVCPLNACGADVGIPGVCGTACTVS